MKLELMIELAAATKQAQASESIVRMPEMETLIARGDPFQPLGSTCDSCLIAMFGYDPAAIAANAALYALGEGLAAGTDYWLRADPVCLAPTTSRVTLSELPDDALTEAEAQALGATLNAHFAPDEQVLFTPHPQRWYLRLPDAPDLTTSSPADCAGPLQESDLPSGRDGAKWKRAITEAQMLLHEHAVNLAREAEGKAPANAIWPWGGGRLPPLSGRPRFVSVWSDDLLARGLARAAGIATHALPRDAESMFADHAASDALAVIRIPHARRSSGMTSIERQWISPLRRALERRQLSELALTVWGARAPIARRVTRVHLRRWWRRRRALSIHG